MDSSTIIFILALVVAFIFLRWFIDSDEDDLDSFNSSSASRTQQDQPNHQEQAQQRNRRAVTTDMIEVVQSVAPHLSVAQIKLDLERTGSVQETVDRILSGAELPFPAGAGAGAGDHHNEASDERNRTNNIKAENLLEKFGIDAASTGVSTSASTKKEWSNDSDERHKTLQQKKADLILKARKRLETQLKNEQDLSGLQD
jgi:coupling of ubiquitin conjugation to ER degradation protein 1